MRNQQPPVPLAPTPLSHPVGVFHLLQWPRPLAGWPTGWPARGACRESVTGRGRSGGRAARCVFTCSFRCAVRAPQQVCASAAARGGRLDAL